MFWQSYVLINRKSTEQNGGYIITLIFYYCVYGHKTKKIPLHLVLLRVPTHSAEISSFSFIPGHVCPIARDLPYSAVGVVLQCVFAMYY